MKIHIQILAVLIFTFLLSSWAGPNELTKQEIITQQKATDALTQILFEYELDENTSFEVEKSGFVYLRIEGLVAISTYANAVEGRRGHTDINGVCAEQGGIEVCPATIIVR